MSWLKDVKGYCSVLSVAVLLCSCSSAVFPDIDEDEEDNSVYSRRIDENGNVTTKDGKKVDEVRPEKGDSLKADKKNVAYEDNDDPELDAAMDPKSVSISDADDVAEAKKSAASTVPVLVEDNDNKEKEEPEVKKETPKEVSAEAGTDVEADENKPSITYQLDTFYFDNGSSVLDSKYRAKIREIVKIAKENKGKVKVLGFASSRTRNTDVATHKLANFKVSSERAQAVANALRRAGLPADQLETEALSDSAPAYLEVMPEGERLNRRAEVYISY